MSDNAFVQRLGGRPLPLLDRDREREVLDGLLANVRGGQSAVLVIRGEGGHREDSVAAVRSLRQAALVSASLRVTGAQAEMELPFAGNPIQFGALYPLSAWTMSLLVFRSETL